MVNVGDLEATFSYKVPVHGDTLYGNLAGLVDPRDVGLWERVRPQKEAVHDLAARDGEEPNRAVRDRESILCGQGIIRSLEPS